MRLRHFIYALAITLLVHAAQSVAQRNVAAGGPVYQTAKRLLDGIMHEDRDAVLSVFSSALEHQNEILIYFPEEYRQITMNRYDHFVANFDDITCGIQSEITVTVH